MTNLANLGLIQQIQDLNSLFDVGVSIHLDSNHILVIEGTDYLGDSETVTVQYSVDTELSWNDDGTLVDVLTPLVDKLKGEKRRAEKAFVTAMA